MPKRAPRICLEPGCNERVTKGRCEQHNRSRQYDRERGADRQFYSTPRWRKFRRWFLARHPWCVLHDGPAPLATVVDHIIPRAERPDLAYVESNCRGLCVSCHNRRTRTYKQE